MAKQVAFDYIQVTNASNYPIYLNHITDVYRVYSTGTVAIGSTQTLSISPVGVPAIGMYVEILWEPTVTLEVSGGSKIDFFNGTLVIDGKDTGDLPSIYSQTKFRVIFYYDSSAWQYQIFPSFDEEGFIDASHIPASEITTAKIEDEAVTTAKMADLAEGSILIGNSSSRPVALDTKLTGRLLIGNGTTLTSVAMSGDATITSAGVLSIAAGVIVNADISASAAIDFSKLAALSSGNILVGSAGNVATSVVMSGDATIDNTGALTIGASVIENSMMADDSVSLSNLDSTGMLNSYTTTTATAANTTETTLASFAIPTYAMDADGETITVYAYGSFGATANNKTIRLRLGATLATATSLAVNTTTAAPNGLNWILRAKIFRTGAAAQKGSCEIIFSGIATEIDNFTATETWSTSTIFISGTNGTAAANDIVLEGFEVVTGKENNN